MKSNPPLKFAIAILALFDLTLSASSRGQAVTATFTNSFGDGTWVRDVHIGVIGNPNDPSIPGNWSTGAYPNNHHRITDPNTNVDIPGSDPFYDVVIALPACTLGTNAGVIVQTLNVANLSTLNLAGGATVAIANGLVTNNGLILVNSTDPVNNTSNLRFDANATVTGTGTILLNGVGYNRANLNLNVATVTLGANQLVHGYGTVIGFGGATLINNGIINGDATTGSMQLALSHNGNQNNNVIKATNGAVLSMSGGSIDQTGGGMFLADGAGSLVEFFVSNNGTNYPVVIGGVLTSANGGVIEPGPGGHAVFLQGCTNSGDLRIPGNADIIVTGTGLTNNHTILVNSTDPIGSISNLRFDASGTLDGTGSVTLNGIGFNRANLNLNVATVTIGANQLVHGYGTIIGFGGATMINNGTINGDDPTGSMQLDLSHTNQNNNLIEATNGATVAMGAGTIDQTGGGTLLADGSGSLIQFFVGNNGTDYPVVVGGLLHTTNGGIIEPGPGGHTVFLQSCTANGDIRIPGSGGIIVTGTGLTNNKTILVNSTDPDNSTSIVRYDASGALDGTGILTLNGNTFNRADLIVNDTFTLTQGANHLIAGKGDIAGNGGTTFVNNGVVNANATPRGIVISGGMAVTNNNLLEATSGSTITVDRVTVDQIGGGKLFATGTGSTVQLGASFNPQITGGTMNTTAGGVISSLSGILAGDITNSGAFQILANGFALSYATTLTNDGTMTLNDSTSLFRFDLGNTAIGGGGSIILTNGAQLVVNGGQAVTNGSTHTIKGNGTIGIVGGGSLTNNGTIAPGLSPGQLNINGDLELGSTSKLSFEIAGTTQGTQYDWLNKTDGGTLTLNGNLTLRLINGFIPASTDAFSIVTTQTILAGAFSNVANGARLNTADGGGSFKVTYTVVNNALLSRNVTLSDFQPAVTALPNLQVTNIRTINRKDKPLGKRITITATISNAGSAAAGASHTSFKDGVNTIGSVATPAIPAGSGMDVSIDWKPTSYQKKSNGSHTLTVAADANGEVAESDEADNTAQKTVTTKGNKVLGE